MTQSAHPANVASSTGPSRSRVIAYWFSTLILGTEGIVGGVLGLVRLPAYTNLIQHLGYPTYLMTILGVWYMLAGLAVLAPRLPRLKEWAYAGLIFNYTGAAASHLVVGDGVSGAAAPAIFIGLTILSCALRPPARRLADHNYDGQARSHLISCLNYFRRRPV